MTTSAVPASHRRWWSRYWGNGQYTLSKSRSAETQRSSQTVSLLLLVVAQGAQHGLRSTIYNTYPNLTWLEKIYKENVAIFKNMKKCISRSNQENASALPTKCSIGIRNGYQLLYFWCWYTSLLHFPTCRVPIIFLTKSKTRAVRRVDSNLILVSHSV